ncbi:protein phosphatase 1 regulatory subunit 32 [Tyto alba]|uniref:protein phosphatase 1 regulatory subunit 32 n=1 Tax=Tyto alba TaxID=56313 RepID=UPI001C67B965|nr:protein phosphatase 1 regulatory subunit 32 [Tyto alba]
MAFVRPRASLRSWAWDSPGTALPSAKARTGGSADLMNFYATTYAVAYGQPPFHPRLGPHTDTGYVSNNRSAVSRLLCQRSAAERQDPATSTMAEHFKPFWLPDGRSLLPRHIHQPGSGYIQGSPLSCLRAGAVSPQHTQLLQRPPKTSRDYGTESCCTGSAQPGTVLGVSVVLGPAPAPRGFGMLVILDPAPLPADLLQKTTIGTKEQSGFTRATPRSDRVLPALPAQPVSPVPTVSLVPCQPLPPLLHPQGAFFSLPQLSVSITTTDYLPSVHSHGGEKLPVLSVGSERGSGFSQEVSTCLGTAGLPTVGHPVVLISRGLQAPRMTQASLLGQQVAGRKEPSGFTKNNGQYVTLSPAAPAQCWRDPTRMAKPIGGIHPQSPSSFSTNNHPTGLGDIAGHLLA